MEFYLEARKSMSETKADIERLTEIANLIRIKDIKMVINAGSGHVGGGMSVAEILAVLYFHVMRIDPQNPEWAERDRFILSKGHAAFALYAALSQVGYIDDDILFSAYSVESCCQAHPELGRCPGVEMSTGPLGQGLSAGIGMALGARMRKRDSRVYVVMGDGECNEGQVWEAMMSASQYKLGNLVAVIDYNKLALSAGIDDVMSLEPLADKVTAFGWNVFSCDGHSVEELVKAFDEISAIDNSKPSLLIAHTVKAKGIKYLEGRQESHATTIPLDKGREVLGDLGCSQEEIDEFMSWVKETK